MKTYFKNLPTLMLVVALLLAIGTVSMMIVDALPYIAVRFLAVIAVASVLIPSVRTLITWLSDHRFKRSTNQFQGIRSDLEAETDEVKARVNAAFANAELHAKLHNAETELDKTTLKLAKSRIPPNSVIGNDKDYDPAVDVFGSEVTAVYLYGEKVNATGYNISDGWVDQMIKNTRSPEPVIVRRHGNITVDVDWDAVDARRGVA